MVRSGKWVFLWGAAPSSLSSGEERYLQLLDSAGRKMVLWAGKKAI